MNETAFGDVGLVVSGRHWVNFTQPEIAASTSRLAQNALFWDVHQTYAVLDTTISEYVKQHEISLSFMKNALPDSLELITLQIAPVAIQSQSNILIRIAHQYSLNDPSPLAMNTTINIQDLFTSSILNVTELVLTATQPIAGKHQPYQWNTSGSEERDELVDYSFYARRVSIPLINFTVTIQPMEIRTFALQLAM